MQTIEIEFETTDGNFTLELYPEKAPITVENFLEYVKNGFYEGTQFHRVIKGFMIQGGGFNADMVQLPTNAPIKNEADNGLLNDVGTIAMARTSVVDSATSQFFINTVNNGFLNFKNKTSQGYGYCVFGKVINGMDVIEKIGNVKTTSAHGHQDVPVTPVVINKVKILTEEKSLKISNGK